MMARLPKHQVWPCALLVLWKRSQRERSPFYDDIANEADLKGLAPSTLPQTTERSTVELQDQNEKKWEALVMLQFVASDFISRHLIYRQAIGSLPLNIENGGVGG
ncbi:MAG: hypothetical protein JWN25_1939 [Verrucomicrobiales bacterium]|nr:hypothetical protein [Verrucomicrobiales bacterium]